jgi:histidine ammonia-lyase
VPVIVLTGHDLTRDQLVRVARSAERVEIDPAAIETMAAGRAVVERALGRGDRVYGLSTAVGVLKRVGLDGPTAGAYANRILQHHLVGQGPPAPDEVVRATILCLANAFAGGSCGVRPTLAEHLVQALNGDLGPLPAVRILGSIGQADLAPMADLAAGLFAGFELVPGEGLALLSSNAFSTAWVALAVSDAFDLGGALETAGALSLEGIAANPSMLHPAIADVRPYPGIRAALENLAALLAGSFIWSGDHARALQDPLTFRNLAHIQGALRDVLDHMAAQLAIELNASQGNPIVVPAEDRVVSVANYEVLPLVLAVDYLRIALASALGAAAERVVKTLETTWSGLPTGLSPGPDAAEPGLAYLGIAVQAFAAEARLLAGPVSAEVVSTSHAEGIEDRTTMAPLAARRLAEMVSLGRRIAAIELTVAAQASQLRGLGPRGRGTEQAFQLLRQVTPYLDEGDVVGDVQPLVELVAGGAFSRAAAVA